MLWVLIKEHRQRHFEVHVVYIAGEFSVHRQVVLRLITAFLVDDSLVLDGQGVSLLPRFVYTKSRVPIVNFYFPLHQIT